MCTWTIDKTKKIFFFCRRVFWEWFLLFVKPSRNTKTISILRHNFFFKNTFTQTLHSHKYKYKDSFHSHVNTYNAKIMEKEENFLSEELRPIGGRALRILPWHWLEYSGKVGVYRYGFIPGYLGDFFYNQNLLIPAPLRNQLLNH